MCGSTDRYPVCIDAHSGIVLVCSFVYPFALDAVQVIESVRTFAGKTRFPFPFAFAASRCLFYVQSEI